MVDQGQFSNDAHELERLLRRDADSEARRVRGLFEAMAGPLASRIVLHGAGNLGARVAEGLRRNGVEPIAFSDASPTVQGTRRAGLQVLSPGEAAERYGSTAAFVPTIWNHRQRYPSILEQLRGLGCERVIPVQALFYRYPSTFLPYYHIDLPDKILRAAPQVRSAFDLLRDAESRQEFLQILRWALDLQFGGPPPHPALDHYFPDDLRAVGPDEVLLDVGAFDGDTIQEFLARTRGSFREIVALEPDPGNFARLETRLATFPEDVRSRIRTHRVGASEAAGRIAFQCDGSSSSGAVDLAAEPILVDTIRLDDLSPGVRPTYIKMDIEGMEPSALRGAGRLVRDNHPALAICVYHRLEHVWEIPNLIAEIRSGYALHLRRYSEWPWEIVCYGIPERGSDRAR